MDPQQKVRIRLTAADKLFLLPRWELSARLYELPGEKGVAGTFELRELEQLLRSLRAEAARALRSKERQRLKDLQDRVVASVSHELEVSEDVPDLSRLVRDPERTPVVCGILMLTSAAYFVFLMQSDGPHDSAFFVRHGADFGPLTLGGEWWRAMASNFVHFDVVHLLFNLAALFLVGPTVERTVGHVVTLVVYSISGLLSSVASLAWEPDLVTGGASGAIYGLYGFAAALVIDHPVLARNRALQDLAKHLLPYAVISFLRGFFEGGVSNAAHTGGVVAGFAMGLVYASRPDGGELAHRLKQGLRLAFGGLVVALVGALLIPRGVVETGAEYARFARQAREIIVSYNDVVRRVNAGEGGPAEVTNVLGFVRPAWQALRGDIGADRSGFDSFRQYFRAMGRFLRMQDSAWTTLVEGIEANDPVTVGRAEEAREEARTFLEDSPRWPDSSLELPPVLPLSWRPTR